MAVHAPLSIDRVGKSLRPVSVLTAIGKVGHDVIESVYLREVQP